MSAETAAVRTPIPAWIVRLFATIDARDARRFVEFIARDGAFHFANAPAAVGREAIHGMVDGFFQAIAGLQHELREAFVLPGRVACHGTVTYTRHDGTRLAVPFATIFAMEGELIRDYRIFMDASALFA